MRAKVSLSLPFNSNILNHRSRVFEDQTDNVSNLGHTGVVFTCCRLPFAGPRAQGGVNFGLSSSQNNGGIVFGK